MMAKLAKLSLSLEGSGAASVHLAEPRLVFIAGAGPEVVRTAVPGFSSKTNTLFAWDEDYNINTQGTQSVQIVLEGSAASALENGSSKAHAQCVQWAKGTQAQPRRLEIPRGYKEGMGQSAVAVGEVELGGSGEPGKLREAELLDLQTGKSIGSITFFLLPGSKEDEQSLKPSTNAQQPNGQALRSAPDQPINPTMQRVREVFNAYTEEAMQTAPFEDREDNLDIMDTGESLRSRQRDDEVVERRFFYVLEDRPLLTERTSRFVETTWVEKEYVREAHLVDERQLPGRTEALDSPQLLRKPSMTMVPDTLEASINGGKAPGSGGNHSRQEDANRSAANPDASGTQVKGAHTPVKSIKAASSSSSSSKQGNAGKKHQQKGHANFAHCTTGLGWLKKRLRGKKSRRGKRSELVASEATPSQLAIPAEDTALTVGAAPKHGTAGVIQPPEHAVGRSEAAAAQAGQALGSGRGGVALPETLDGTDDQDPTMSNIVRDPTAGHNADSQSAEKTGYSGVGIHRSRRGELAGQNSDGLGPQKGSGRSGVHQDSTRSASPPSGLKAPDQGMGVRSADRGVGEVAADMNAAMQVAVVGVIGQEGPGVPAGHAADNSLAKSSGTGLEDSLAKGPDSPAPLRSYFTVIEERRVFKERVERFIKHHIFECEYVFEVRCAGERAKKIQHLPAKELISREVRVLA